MTRHSFHHSETLQRRQQRTYANSFGSRTTDTIPAAFHEWNPIQQSTLAIGRTRESRQSAKYGGQFDAGRVLAVL